MQPAVGMTTFFGENFFETNFFIRVQPAVGTTNFFGENFFETIFFIGVQPAVGIGVISFDVAAIHRLHPAVGSPHRIRIP